MDDEDLPLEGETRYGCGFGPFCRKVRFGDGYSQRAPAGLNANLKTIQRDAFCPREEATVLESFLEEHGGLEILSVDAAL
ncbi:phage tail protein [Escherichia coli]|uniref:phage tail protein n=1 Tax=Escherichia coli TaxID=562 RepID=UPI00388ED695